MSRVWLLRCLVGLSLVAVSFAAGPALVAAQEKEAKADEAALPEGEDAEEVFSKIRQQLFMTGIPGIETFEKQKIAFYKKYATDPGRWQMKLLEASLLQQTGEKLGGGGRTSKEILKEIAEGKDVPDEMRPTASAMTVQSLASEMIAGKAKLADVIKAAEAHLEKYPRSPVNRQLGAALVESVARVGGDEAEKQLVALSESKHDALSSVAEAKLKVFRIRKELMSKPLELSFKAVDGREVDFAKMRGKVVLVDFWATWCGPCMAEVPNVVKTYKKLHDKGFEIVGISLDDDEAKLKKVAAENGMSWPHHFDGQGWQNELAQKYGINSIPEMWLVSKKGMVKTYSRDQDLTEEVEKLLAE